MSSLSDWDDVTINNDTRYSIIQLLFSRRTLAQKESRCVAPRGEKTVTKTKKTGPPSLLKLFCSFSCLLDRGRGGGGGGGQSARPRVPGNTCTAVLLLRATTARMRAEAVLSRTWRVSTDRCRVCFPVCPHGGKAISRSTGRWLYLFCPIAQFYVSIQI